MGKKRKEEQPENDASSTDMRKKSLENGDRMPLEEIPPAKFSEMFASIHQVLTEILRSMQVKERMKEKYEEKSRKMKEQQEEWEEKYEKKFRKIKAGQEKMKQKYKEKFRMIEEQQGEMSRLLKELKENGTLSPPQRAQPDQIQRPRFSLQFKTKVNDTVYKGKSIRTNKGDCVEVQLNDGDNQIGPDHPLSSAKVKLVVLNGEFNKDDDQDYWSKEDFEKSIRVPRERKSIVRNCTFQLDCGFACHRGATILDNSNRKEVRLGVMVVGHPEERVLEGISKHFRVQEAKTERQEPAGGAQPSCTQTRVNGHVLPCNVQQQSPSQVPMPNLSQPTITPSVKHGQGHVAYEGRQSFPRATTSNSSQPCSNQIMGNGQVPARNDQQSFPQFHLQDSSQPTIGTQSLQFGLVPDENDQQSFLQFRMQDSSQLTVATQSLQYGRDQAAQSPPNWGYPNFLAGSSMNQQQASITEGHLESAGDIHHLYSQTQNQAVYNFKSGNGGSHRCGQVQLLWYKPDIERKQSWDILDKLMPLYTRHCREYSGLFAGTNLVYEYDQVDYFLKMLRVLGITHQNRGILIQPIEPNGSEDEPLFRWKRRAQYQLRFVNKVCKEYYTREQIKAEDGDLLKVSLYSEDNLRITSGPLSSASVEIVLLHGDFNADGRDYWSSKEFNEQTLCPQSALGGDRVLIMTNGEASLANVAFQKTSSFARTGMFKMGVKMKLALEVRVKEGITEPFLVRSHKGEGTNKNCTPSVGASVGALTKSFEVCTEGDDARLFSEEGKESFRRASAAEFFTSGVQAFGAACGFSAVGQRIRRFSDGGKLFDVLSGTVDVLCVILFILTLMLFFNMILTVLDEVTASEYMLLLLAWSVMVSVLSQRICFFLKNRLSDKTVMKCLMILLMMGNFNYLTWRMSRN